MNGLSPRESVALYVARCFEEFEGTAAELLRRVGDELRRDEPYVRNAHKGWVTKGNAPADVLIALYRITGLSIDLYAGLRERQPTTEDRLADLERKFERVLIELEQVRRETGEPYRATEDRPRVDDLEAQP